MDSIYKAKIDNERLNKDSLCNKRRVPFKSRILRDQNKPIPIMLARRFQNDIISQRSKVEHSARHTSDVQLVLPILQRGSRLVAEKPILQCSCVHLVLHHHPGKRVVCPGKQLDGRYIQGYCVHVGGWW